MFAHLVEANLTARPRPLVVGLTVVIVLSVVMMGGASVLRRAASASEITANTATTVSAASFEADAAVAPDSIVAIFGSGLATSTEIAATIPIPLSLAGTTVLVRDSLGVTRQSGLFFVSAFQVNCIIPAATAPGEATVTVIAANAVVSSGVVQIAAAAPGIFTANTNAAGVPAGDVLHIRPDASRFQEPVFQGTYPNFVPRPIDLGPAGEQVFLVLYLTGLRGIPSSDGNAANGSAENVSVLIGGLDLPTSYAGPAPGFEGLDQINVVIARSLLGRGQLSLNVSSNGFGTSKPVEIDIATPPGSQPPTVTSVIGPASLLAQDLITLNGTSFSVNPADNVVRIGGVEAGVEAASPTQLQARVQFGSRTGPLTVANVGGQWTSPGSRSVRTSISGLVLDTSGQPLQGAKVTLVANASSVLSKPEGWFVLPDTPINTVLFTIEVPSVLGSFNPTPLKIAVEGQRDNPYQGAISLQQASGAAITVGGPGLTFSKKGTSKAGEAPESSISVGGVTLTLPDGLTAIFPGGESTGTLTLDVLKDSLTPAPLPPSIFSSSVAQISPFGVKLQPGARLTFPNLDGFPGNAQLKLYKYDIALGSPTVGSFIDTGKLAVVTPNGSSIETEPNAVIETSDYFVALARPLTTIIGRVVDSDGVTPRRGAIVRARGQEAQSDGNGGFVLRRVPSKEGDQILVSASFLRPIGRVDRASKTTPPTGVNRLANVGDLVLPSATSNRPPLIYARTSTEMYVEQTLVVPVTVIDLDAGQITDASATGPAFIQLTKSTSEGLHLLRLQPHVGQEGNYTVAITATDGAGGSKRHEMSLLVRPLPLANPQSVGTNEDVAVPIALAGSDAGNRPLTFKLKTAPIHGVLSTFGPGVTYTPAQNYNGPDSFTFAVDNGFVESSAATVSIAVTPVNDAPIIVVPGAQSTDVNKPLSFGVSATDVDTGQVLTLTATNLPAGAQFNQTGPNTGTFTWTPALAGAYSVNFTVKDNAPVPLSDSKSVAVTVLSLGTWRPTAGPDGGTITAFYNSGNIILAGTDGNGIYRSTDNGASWLGANSGLGDGFITSFTTLQAFGASNILVGTEGGVFRSTNGGQSWTALNGGLTNGSVKGLTNAAGVVFAGTDGGGVFRLNNVNGLWSAANASLGNLSISALTSIGELLYAATAAGVFTSVSGQMWSAFSAGLPASRVVSFALPSTQNGTAIIAGTQGSGVYLRLPGSGSWTSLNSGLGNLTVNTVASDGANLIFAGTTLGGVFRYDSGGQVPGWVAANNGLTNPIVRSLIATGQAVFAGTQEGGVFRTFDNGNNWAPANNGIPRARVSYLLASGNSLFAATIGGGVHASSNNGTSWAGINNGLTNLVISSLAASVGNLFAGTIGSGIFRSSNNGASWSTVNSGLGNGDIQSLAFSGTTLFAGTGAGSVFISTNNGSNWSSASNGLGGSAVYALFANAGFVYAGTDGSGIYRTSNNGASWIPANNGLGSTRVGSFAVVGAAVFAGTLDGGVYRSTDNGASWSSVNNGISSSDIYALTVSGNRIYAGSNGGGVFTSADSGNSWSAVSQGLVFPFVLTLAGNGSKIFAGTDGGGVFILE